MKKLLMLGLLVSSLSFSIYHFNGKIVNGECVYPFKRREKIVDKLFRDRKQKGTYVYLYMVADDFETVITWYDHKTNKKVTDKLQFCKIGGR